MVHARVKYVALTACGRRDNLESSTAALVSEWHDDRFTIDNYGEGKGMSLTLPHSSMVSLGARLSASKGPSPGILWVKLTNT